MTEPTKKYKDMSGHGKVGLWPLLTILCGAGAFGGAIGAAKSLKLEGISFAITLFAGLIVAIVYFWTIQKCGEVVLRSVQSQLQSSCNELKRKADFATGALLVIGFICFFAAAPIGLSVTMLFYRLLLE
jgi:hypothetical protein